MNKRAESLYALHVMAIRVNNNNIGKEVWSDSVEEGCARKRVFDLGMLRQLQRYVKSDTSTWGYWSWIK